MFGRGRRIGLRNEEFEEAGTRLGASFELVEIEHRTYIQDIPKLTVPPRPVLSNEMYHDIQSALEGAQAKIALLSTIVAELKNPVVF
jgi:hypothetical protein